MADLSITATLVAPSTGAAYADRGPLAGEAITAGQVVYLKSSDNTWRLAQCDGTAEEAGSAVTLGIALNGASTGQVVNVQTGGIITAGATVVVGKVYLVSATAGGIAPVSDITTSTHKVSFVGIGATSATIKLYTTAVGYSGYAIP